MSLKDQNEDHRKITKKSYEDHTIRDHFIELFTER